MAVYDTMNLRNKGGAVPTYQRDSVYSPGSNRNGRLQSDVNIQQQTGEAITRTANTMRAMDIKRMELISRGLELEKGALDATIRAGERLAGGVDKIVEAIANYQDKYSEVKASELAMQYRMKLRDLLYKDDGTGLMQTQQEGAKDSGKLFKEGANGFMEDLLDGQSNDVRGKFFSKVNEFNLSQLDSVNQHEATEMKKWEINTLTAEAQNFGDLAIENSDKPQLMADYLAQSSSSYRKAYMAAGFSGEALDRKIVEHTSANIAFAIKKNIKNNVGRAESMLAGSTKYMTAKDINDVGNSILAQKNYLETKALRAEQAAIAREERANRKFYAGIQKPIKDTMALLWNGGEADGDNIQKIYDGLVSHGFVEQAEAFRGDVDTALASRQVIAEAGKLSIPELENNLVVLTNNFSKNLDINGKPMTSKAEIDKMRKIITGLEGALKHRITGRDRDPAEYSRGKDNPTMTPVSDSEGGVSIKEFIDASLESQKKDGVPEHEQVVLTKSELEKTKFELEKSTEPFTYLNGQLQALSPNAQRIFLRQLEKTNISVRNLGLLSTIDPTLANELYRYQLDKKNPDTGVRRLGMDNLEAKFIKVKGLAQTMLQNANNKAILESFPIEQQAIMLSTMSDIGEMLIVKKGNNYDEMDAVEAAWDIICGKYQTTNIGGTNLRIPSKDSGGKDVDSTMFKLNLQNAVNDFYKDTNSEDFKYIFRNVPADMLPMAVNDMANKTTVINDGKGGYILAWKETGMPMTVGEGKNIHYVKINKTDDELSEDGGIKVMEGIDLPKNE